MSNNTPEQTEILKGKVNSFLEAQRNLLKDNGLLMSGIIEFPMYRELPVDVRLALMILERNGATIVQKFDLDPNFKPADDAKHPKG